MVMILSSLVISYVIYHQNLNAANVNITVAMNNIKNKIREFQTDLIKKIDLMNNLFKVGKNVKFIVEYKDSLGLDMIKRTFSDLANGLFTTSSTNQINKIAIYDANGNLIVFS